MSGSTQHNRHSAIHQMFQTSFFQNHMWGILKDAHQKAFRNYMYQCKAWGWKKPKGAHQWMSMVHTLTKVPLCLYTVNFWPVVHVIADQSTESLQYTNKRLIISIKMFELCTILGNSCYAYLPRVHGHRGHTGSHCM